jgi:AP-1 complex subunit beta-1
MFKNWVLGNLGELAELRNDLKSEKKEKKKEAVKKIIASMTVGKDVR